MMREIAYAMTLAQSLWTISISHSASPLAIAAASLVAGLFFYIGQTAKQKVPE